jgi:hypothetical protein
MPCHSPGGVNLPHHRSSRSIVESGRPSQPAPRSYELRTRLTSWPFRSGGCSSGTPSCRGWKCLPGWVSIPSNWIRVYRVRDMLRLDCSGEQRFHSQWPSERVGLGGITGASGEKYIRVPISVLSTLFELGDVRPFWLSYFYTVGK